MDATYEELEKEYDFLFLEYVQPDYDQLNSDLVDIFIEPLEENKVKAGFFMVTLFRFTKQVLKTLFQFVSKSLNRFIYWITGFDRDKTKKVKLANGKTVKINFEDDITTINRDIDQMTSSMQRATRAQKRRDIKGMERERDNMKEVISKKDVAKTLTFAAASILSYSILKSYRKMKKDINTMVMGIDESTLRSAGKELEQRQNGQHLANLDKEISGLYAEYVKKSTRKIDRFFRKLHLEQRALRKSARGAVSMASHPESNSYPYFKEVQRKIFEKEETEKRRKQREQTMQDISDDIMKGFDDSKKAAKDTVNKVKKGIDHVRSKIK